MATLLARLQGRTQDATVEPIPGIDLLTPEEARALFDRRARQLLHISGEEFLQRWDAGEFRPVRDDADGRKVGKLVMMMPFARRRKS
ncbi:MAG: hypothetical protein ACRERD_15095 [Candidatus Binatia bacterium]